MQSAFPAVYATLAAGTRAPAQARNEVGRACHGWSTSTIDTAKLLVSELVTNAVVHGAGNIALAIARVPSLLRVEVTDAGANLVRPLRDTHVNDEYGRGLYIVATLATAWGGRPGIVSDGHVSDGNMVWFELRPDAPDIDVATTATDDNRWRLLDSVDKEHHGSLPRELRHVLRAGVGVHVPTRLGLESHHQFFGAAAGPVT